MMRIMRKNRFMRIMRKFYANYAKNRFMLNMRKKNFYFFINLNA